MTVENTNAKGALRALAKLGAEPLLGVIWGPKYLNLIAAS